MAENKVVQVEDIDPTKRNSAFNEPEEAAGDTFCWLNGQKVGEGSIICVKHQELVCTRSGWQNTGQKC